MAVEVLSAPLADEEAALSHFDNFEGSHHILEIILARAKALSS